MTGSPWIFFFLISQTRPLGASNNLSVTAQVSPLSTDSCGDCCLWVSAPLSCDSQCLSIGVSNLEGSSLPCQRRQWHPTPVLLPGKSHGRRSLVGCSPWSREELGMTEWLHFHFSLSCIGEGNGNPLQCSCLENPRDGGAWWAAVYGVAQGRTRLKRLSSSSSSLPCDLTSSTDLEELVIFQLFQLFTY